MTEISNYGAEYLLAPAGQTPTPATISGPEAVADTAHMHLKIPSTPGPDKTDGAPGNAVQKNTETWETFAAEAFEGAKPEVSYHDPILKFDDAGWARKDQIMGARYVAISKSEIEKSFAKAQGALAAVQRGLSGFDIVISGTISQKNNHGEFEIADFEISKSGIGYKLLFKGADASEIDYRPAWSSSGQDPASLDHKSMLNNDLSSVVFRERGENSGSTDIEPREGETR